jgi:hypothetical protein
VYEPTDPFFVDVRSPTLSQLTTSLLDDDCDLLNLQGSPWSLTLYVDYVYSTKINRPGDGVATAYTRMNPLGQEGLYRRNDVQESLSGATLRSFDVSLSLHTIHHVEQTPTRRFVSRGRRAACVQTHPRGTYKDAL